MGSKEKGGCPLSVFTANKYLERLDLRSKVQAILLGELGCPQVLQRAPVVRRVGRHTAGEMLSIRVTLLGKLIKQVVDNIFRVPPSQLAADAMLNLQTLEVEAGYCSEIVSEVCNWHTQDGHAHCSVCNASTARRQSLQLESRKQHAPPTW